MRVLTEPFVVHAQPVRLGRSNPQQRAERCQYQYFDRPDPDAAPSSVRHVITSATEYGTGT
jgi:hypothetical protein